MAADLVTFGLALAGTGAIAGILAGLLGVGGGIVIVPVLYLVLPHLGVAADDRMHVAVGTSLAVIVATTLVSAWSHARQGDLDITLFRGIALPVLAGAGAGAAVAGLVSGVVLAAVFGTIALFVAVYMAFLSGLTISDRLPGHPLRDLSTGGIGMVSVMMGLGGGTLMVPFLTAHGVGMKIAVGTAAALSPIMAAVGVVGVAASGWGVAGLPPASLGYVNLFGFLLIAPLAMALAPVGARIARHLPTRSLKMAFAAFLCLTGLNMLYDAGLGRFLGL